MFTQAWCWAGLVDAQGKSTVLFTELKKANGYKMAHCICFSGYETQTPFAPVTPGGHHEGHKSSWHHCCPHSGSLQALPRPEFKEENARLSFSEFLAATFLQHFTELQF